MKKIQGLALIVVCVVLVPAAAYAACNADITPTKPDSIYTDNGDGTVTDNKTGLMWKQCSEGLSGAACDAGFIETYTWQMALQHVAALNAGAGFAGYKDWRLPNRRELLSLVEFQCYEPAINSNLFPNTHTALEATFKYYWTSSPELRSGGGTWAFYFATGEERGYVKESDAHFVRLVRGGL